MGRLNVDGVSFSYQDKAVLSEIRFQVDKGGFLGVIGPNGSGKTTLLRILSGVLKPVQGHVFFDGRPLHEYGRRALARRMAVVAQEFGQTFPMTAEQVVLMGRFPHMARLAFESARDLGVVRRAMVKTDTVALAHRYFHELSGGERQRVVIARALAQEPEVVLFDEPTAFLDIRHQIEFFDFVWELNRDMGLTIVAVSHDINLAAQYCRELLLLSEGRVFEKGPAERVVTEKNIEAVYRKRVILDQNPLYGSPRITLMSQLESFGKE